MYVSKDFTNQTHRQWQTAITGRIHRITPEQTITGKSGKTFTKRTLILDAARYDTHTGEKKYDNYPSVEFWGDGMKILDNFKEGELVTVSFDLNGRELKDEQTGEVKYFTSVRGYKIESTGQQTKQQAQTPAQTQSPQGNAVIQGERGTQPTPEQAQGMFPPKQDINNEYDQLTF